MLGGLGFVLPGLVLILGLSVLFLAGSPPAWVRGAGAGAGAAVAAVAVRAGVGLIPSSWTRAPAHRRWIAYALLGGLAGAQRCPRRKSVTEGAPGQLPNCINFSIWRVEKLMQFAWRASLRLF